MQSNNISYIPRLDHLRFLAAMLVFLFHWQLIFGDNWKSLSSTYGLAWLTDGYTGVSLFFVLSGYLLMSIAMRSNGNIEWALFIKNRILRVFPLFSFVFFVALSLTRDKFRPENLLYFFVTNLGLTAPTSDHFITGAAWSISVEFTFYLIFPFVARFAIAEGSSYLIRLIFLLMIFKVGGYFTSERANLMFYSTLLGRLDQFLIGMLAAQCFSQRRELKLPTVGLLVSVLITLGLVEMQSHFSSFVSGNQKHPLWIFWPTIEATAWASVIVTYLVWNGRFPYWVNNALEKGGEISFSIYLWHGVIIFIFSKFFSSSIFHGNSILYGALALVACLVCTIYVSYLSYITIERPFLRLRANYTGCSSR